MEESQSASRGRPHRFEAAIVSLVLVVASLVSAWSVYQYSGLKVGPNEYNLPAWELRNFPTKWLFAIHDLFRPARGQSRQDADMQRFFQLTREIEALEQSVGDATSRGTSNPTDELSLREKRQERDKLENYVEATIEARLTTVIKEAGVTRDFGPLGEVVWPPADFEFTTSPRSLAISPRDHIALTDSRLLREGLNLEAVEKIEAETERKENVSALAFPTGGIGAYPTIVDYPDSYRDALEVIAHEWTHNYLSFRPLGIHYYENSDLRALNETTADLVGHELAGLIYSRWPLKELPDPPSTAPQTQQPTPSARVDVGAELRELRGEVDTLLAAGQIEDAETLMEQRR